MERIVNRVGKEEESRIVIIEGCEKILGSDEKWVFS